MISSRQATSCTVIQQMKNDGEGGGRTRDLCVAHVLVCWIHARLATERFALRSSEVETSSELTTKQPRRTEPVMSAVL